MITKAELEYMDFSVDAANAVLQGDKNRLWGFAEWHRTPQGYHYWSKRASTRVDGEARAILQEWVDVWEGRKPAGDDASEPSEAPAHTTAQTESESIAYHVTHVLRSLGYNASAVGIVSVDVEYADAEGGVLIPFILTIKGGIKQGAGDE